MKTNKKTLRKPKAKKPHYLHSSMFGTYYEPCTILERRGDALVIKFLDPVSGVEEERVVDIVDVEML